MSERLSRKEIKQKDQFVSAVEGGLDYGRSHLRTIGIAAAAIVGIAIVIVSVVLWGRHREVQANEALDRAVEAYRAPVSADAAAVPEAARDELTFDSEQARRQRAKELFEEVLDDHGGSAQAELATLYLADLAVEEGNLERAEELWREFLDEHDGDLLSVQVRLNLLALRRDSGDQAGVAEELQAMLEDEETPLPEDVILFELAQTLEDLSRDDEALTYYQRIVDEYPSSRYLQQALLKTQELGGAVAA